MKRLALLGALPAMLALGLPVAKAQESDPRLVTRVYNATQVVKIHGRPGVQATIAFAEDEKIENVAVGDSDKWQITPNKRANLLFARPLDAAAVTNMTVVTDKRTYLFDLVASAKEQPVYMLTFTYRDGPFAAPSAVVASAPPPPVLAAPPQEALPPVPRLVEVQPPGSTPPATSPQVAEQSAKPVPVAPRRPAVAIAPPQPEPYPQPQPLEPALSPPSSPALPARSVIDVAVGAPVDDLPAGKTGLLAEANKPGDPAPAPSTRPKRERPKREEKVKKVRVAKPDPAPQVPQVVASPIFASPAGPVSPTEWGSLNFSWIRKGKSSLLPMRVYDDGRATYLIWGAKQTIPTVVLAGPEGGLAPPEMTRHEHSVVISSVPSRIELRAGNTSATLDNLRGQPAGVSLAGPLSSGRTGSSQ